MGFLLRGSFLDLDFRSLLALFVSLTALFQSFSLGASNHEVPSNECGLHRWHRGCSDRETSAGGTEGAESDG